MKLTFDYENKIVTIKGDCNLKYIVDVVKSTVDDWKEWDINGSAIQWTYPIYPEWPTITYNTP